MFPFREFLFYDFILYSSEDTTRCVKQSLSMFFFFFSGITHFMMSCMQNDYILLILMCAYNSVDCRNFVAALHHE